ncbi:hypothetical protein [Azospirillum sp. TSO22-1]|uniref:hypothetical protein n=1 Tax=Azospirillum sp. TSO22-1 TaxID=716789 RepID=UPI000D621C14|nr:hypothetical protein [Azospirillum sp. TSO22-1]PWC42109.1 hypothetical protein TSO221_22230 [Azospirillum sp. TSO22-1]
MRYHVMAGGTMGVISLKRDTLDGAIKKAGELRQSHEYEDVRIIDTESGAVVEEPKPTVQ